MTELNNDNLLEIIAQKDSEIAKLIQERTSLRNIILEMPGNVFWKDKEGVYQGCNKNVANFVGLQSPEEIVGKRLRDMLSDEIATAIEKEEKDFEALEGKYVEQIGLDQDQNPTYFLTQRVPLRNESGEVVGLLGVSMDITERKRMEEELRVMKNRAEASNRAKSRFLAVINHELRTPLTSIIGLVDLLKQKKLSGSERKHVVDSMQSCSKHLLNLVNDILDYSKLEAGKYQVSIDTLSMDKLIHETTAILKPLAEQKGLDFIVVKDASVPKVIYSDFRLLCQVLINLGNNAIKFTERGQVRLQFTSQKLDGNKCKLEIKVIDTGMGIPAHKIISIFKPFQQLEDVYERQTSKRGTGLGLTIVKNIASLIGFQIHVASEQGKGSIFTLSGEFSYLEKAISKQLADLDVHKINADKSLRKKSNPVRKRQKVLLVEDDEIIQFIHKKMLIDLGCKVEVASTGRDAIAAAPHHDIIFVDISLPDLNGIEVIKHLRSLEKTQHVPIVALTAYAGGNEKMLTLEAGADEFVTKPISQENLKLILDNFSKISG